VSPRHGLADATATPVARPPSNAISIAMKLDQSVPLADLHQTRAVSEGRPAIFRYQGT